MEVKTVTAKLRDIKNDFSKLSGMRSEAGYLSTIFLIFGKNSKKRASHIRNFQLQWGFDSNIEIWAHENANKAASQL